MIKEDAYGKFKYLLYVPSHLENTDNLPLIVVLHGSGEIGSSLSKLKKREPYISLNNGKFKTDAFVLMPQLPKGTWGKMPVSFKALVEHIADTYKCDLSRISLTGHSLGAMGVIEIMLKYPNSFSAGASLSAAKNYKTELQKIAHMPIYFLYGEKEHNYKRYAREMFAVMDTLNEEAKLTAVRGYGHPIQFTWVNQQYGIFDYLMSYRVGDLKNPTWSAWLQGQGVVDDSGKVTSKASEQMSDDITKKLGIKKERG